MPRATVVLAALVTLASLPAARADEPPAQPADALDGDLREGVRRHDAGDYDGAIAIYRYVLNVHPDDEGARVELTLSLLAKGDYTGAIAEAEGAIAAKPRSPPQLYVTLGAAHDAKGEVAQGEQALRRGLLVWPDAESLHFNLGINLIAQGKAAEAERALSDAVIREPGHASAWKALAEALRAKGLETSAFVAHVRYLTLDGGGSTAPAVVARLQEILFQRVSRGHDGDKETMTITLPGAAQGASHEVFEEALLVATVGATRRTRQWRDRSAGDFLADAVATVVKLFLENGDHGKGWRRVAFEYFGAARTAGHLDALAHEALRCTQDPDVLGWLERHRKPVQAYRAWSADFGGDRGPPAAVAPVKAP